MLAVARTGTRRVAMARLHTCHGRLAAGVAALSLVAACSGGAGGFKGAGGVILHPPRGALGGRGRLPDRRGALPPGVRRQPQFRRGAAGPRPQLCRHGAVCPRRAGAERGQPAQAEGSGGAAGAFPHAAGRRPAAGGADQPRHRLEEAAARRADHHRARYRARPAQPPRRGAGDLSAGAGARSHELRAADQPRPLAGPLGQAGRRHRDPRDRCTTGRPTRTPAATWRCSTAWPGASRRRRRSSRST